MKVWFVKSFGSQYKLCSWAQNDEISRSSEIFISV